MNYKVLWRSAANRDVNEALDWYDAEAPRQIERFLDHLREAERAISHHPLLQRELEPDLRRFTLRTFPYEIWYRVNVERGTVQVLAFKHERRDSDSFENRLD